MSTALKQSEPLLTLTCPSEIEETMTKAKVQIIAKNAFYATLLCNSRVWYTDSVPTMATDGRDIYVNPAFVTDIGRDNTIGVMVHEVIHKALLHPTRRGNRDGKLWNVAIDIVTNGIVLADGYSIPPGVVDKKLQHLPAEEIYRMMETEQDRKFAGKTPAEWKERGDAPDHLLPAPATEAEVKQLEMEVKIQNAQGLARVKSTPGSSSGIPILKHIEKILQPKVDWKARLRDFISSTGKDDWTFAKPNQRYMAHGFYLPHETGVQVGRLMVAIDTSGSIFCHADLVDQFVAEVRTICEDVLPESLDVLYMDTKVQGHDTFEQFDEFEVNLKGGGGTAFASTFDYIADLEEPPVAVIVFTDMEVFDLDKCQCNIPTLWMQYGGGNTPKAEPPFGVVVPVE